MDQLSFPKQSKGSKKYQCHLSENSQPRFPITVTNRPHSCPTSISLKCSIYILTVAGFERDRVKRLQFPLPFSEMIIHMHFSVLQIQSCHNSRKFTSLPHLFFPLLTPPCQPRAAICTPCKFFNKRKATNMSLLWSKFHFSKVGLNTHLYNQSFT